MFVFSYVIKLPQKGYPFFIFLVSGLFPWNYLILSISASTTSLLDRSDIIKKVYFPRAIIPMSIVAVNLVLFIVSLGLMLIFLIICKVRLTPLVFLLPVIILMQTFFILGFSFVVSSLQVKYRDIKYIVEVLLFLWFYLTPIFYPLDLIAVIPGPLLKIYMLNPLTQLITFYRIALISNYVNSIPSQIDLLGLMLSSFLICATVFFFGFIIFKKQEQQFVDLI
jgi:ABC-2 type transport system permease protein